MKILILRGRARISLYETGKLNMNKIFEQPEEVFCIFHMYLIIHLLNGINQIKTFSRRRADVERRNFIGIFPSSCVVKINRLGEIDFCKIPFFIMIMISSVRESELFRSANNSEYRNSIHYDHEFCSFVFFS